MSHPLRIWLAEQDVSAFVVRDDLPEWLETSVKGAGWFEWQVKGFEFRLHESCPVVPAWGQTVRVVLSGVTRFTGVVDEVDEYDGPVPRVTCQPPAVTLKDVMAGVRGVGSDGHEQWRFDIDEPLSIQAACALVLSRYNENRDPRLALVDDWTVTVSGDAADPVPTFAPHGLTGPAAGVNHYERGTWPPAWVLQMIGGADYDTPLPASQWAEIRQDDATGELLLGFYVAWWAWDEPNVRYSITEAYSVVRLPAGGPPSSNVVPGSGYLSVAEWQAYPMAGDDSGRPSDLQITEYTRRESGIGDEPVLTVAAVADLKDGTWAVTLYEDEAEGRFWLYCTWWGNPLSQTISGRWKNVSMIDLLKQFALVSGRWLRIVGNAVSLLPRETGDGEVLLPDSGQAIEASRKRSFGSPTGQVQVEVLDRSNAESTGMDYGLGKVAALQFWYIDRFTGERVESGFTFPVALFPAGLQLLSEPPEGIVTDLDFSTDGRLFRLKTVQEGL